MSITTGQPIIASDFVDTSAGAADAGKVPKLNGSGKLDSSFIVSPFGGTGADGALSVTSGTTTIDLGGAAVVIKNYSSISITGGTLNFTNPATNGTYIILKSKGNVTVTGGTISTAGVGAAVATAGFVYIGTVGAASGTTGGAAANPTFFKAALLPKTTVPFIVGGGGANGNAGTFPGATGGTAQRGSGALYIECGGALNFTGTISASGTAGGSAAGSNNSSANQIGPSGAGGSGAGSVVILYNTLTANSGTITTAGGAGGSGVQLTGSGSQLQGATGGGGGGSYTAGGGGDAGTNNSNWSQGGNGGAGGNGFSLVAQNTEFV